MRLEEIREDLLNDLKSGSKNLEFIQDIMRSIGKGKSKVHVEALLSGLITGRDAVSAVEKLNKYFPEDYRGKEYRELFQRLSRDYEGSRKTVVDHLCDD